MIALPQDSGARTSRLLPDDADRHVEPSKARRRRICHRDRKAASKNGIPETQFLANDASKNTRKAVEISMRAMALAGFDRRTMRYNEALLHFLVYIGGGYFAHVNGDRSGSHPLLTPETLSTTNFWLKSREEPGLVVHDAIDRETRRFFDSFDPKVAAARMKRVLSFYDDAKLTGDSYDLFTNNCETVAYEILTGYKGNLPLNNVLYVGRLAAQSTSKLLPFGAFNVGVGTVVSATAVKYLPRALRCSCRPTLTSDENRPCLTLPTRIGSWNTSAFEATRGCAARSATLWVSRAPIPRWRR